jgi:TonB-dependent starch-binding outer membrane protein SusC
MNRLRWPIAMLFAMALIPAAASAQARGTVTGSVVDAATQRPLSGAQITIAGTQLGTLTNQQGRFLIPNVPVGPQQVRAVLIGFGQATQPVTVVEGETATVNLQLRETAVALEGVIVTATGETQRRREIGNAVTNISVDPAQLAAVSNMGELLQARAPGVTVQQSSGTTGTGTRVRIRGSNSISLNNEPLIIIDGVRVNNSPTSHSIGGGGQAPSRMNDINPDDIESIEILKGPAATALYGTAAATGVIQITTRRGRAGAAQWGAYFEGGRMHDHYDYPANFGREGLIPAAGGTFNPTNQCTLFRQATGACVQPGAFLEHSPLEAVNPFRNDGWGEREKYGVNVSGGGDAATYYFSGDHERERGIYPNNDLQRVNLRGNVRTQLRDDLDVTVTTGFTSSNLLLPQNDNNLLGQLGGALLGRPVDDALRGFAAATPRQIETNQWAQEVRRFMGGLNAGYRPTPWLNVTALAGLDMLNRHDNQTQPANIVPFGTWPEGWRTSNRFEVANVNTSLAATGSFQLTDMICAVPAGAGAGDHGLRRAAAAGYRAASGHQRTILGRRAVRRQPHGRRVPAAAGGVRRPSLPDGRAPR